MSGQYSFSDLEGYRDRSMQEQDDARSTRRALLLLVGWGLVLLYCAAIVFDWWPWLRGWSVPPLGWSWPTYAPPIVRLFPVAATMAAIWAVVTVADFSYLIREYHTERRVRNATVILLYLLAMILLGYGLQLSILGLKGVNASRYMIERLTAATPEGFFTFAARATSIQTFLHNYPNFITEQICPGCANHPPGMALFYWSGIQTAKGLPIRVQHDLADTLWSLLGGQPSVGPAATLSDTQLLGAFFSGTSQMILAAAAVVPVFALGRLLGPRGGAFKLAAITLSIPGLMLMSPGFEPMYAFISASALYFAVRGLLASDGLAGSIWALAAGLMLAVGLLFSLVFFTFLLAVVLMAVVVLAAGRVTVQEAKHDEPQMHLGYFLSWLTGLVIGVFGSLGLLALATDTHLLYVFSTNLDNLATIEAARPYLPWLFQGPLDFLQFLGLPLVVVVVMVTLRGKRVTETATVYTGQVDDAPSRYFYAPSPPWYERINVYSLVLMVTVLAVAVTGTSKVQQGKTLMLLAPLALAAVSLWAGRDRPRAIDLTQLFAAQMLIMLSIAATWAVP